MSRARACPLRGPSPVSPARTTKSRLGHYHTVSGTVRFDRLFIEESQPREEAVDHFAEVLLTDVDLDGVSQEVDHEEGVVVGYELTEGFGGGQLVETEVHDGQLQQPMEALHMADLVPRHV